MQSEKRASSVFKWIGANAAILTAVSSMIIAGLSLYFTIHAQRTDIEYKELSIQPRFWLGADWDGMALILESTGLGPALVKRIDVKLDGKCVSSDDLDPEEWPGTFGKFINGILPELYSKTLPPMPWSPNGKKAYDIESDVLRPGDILRPGTKKSLVRLDPATYSQLLKVDSTLLVQVKDRFAAAAYKAPIRITACSVSGRTCGFIGIIEGCSYN